MFPKLISFKFSHFFYSNLLVKYWFTQISTLVILTDAQPNQYILEINIIGKIG